jgi:hypothetical protein
MSDTVSNEQANAEFDRWAEDWDIDSDVSAMDLEAREVFNSQRRRLVRAIRAGHLAVGDDSTLRYQLRFPVFESITDLVFRPPSGEALLGFDKFRDRENFHKLNTFMGSMTGAAPAIFVKMDARDLKIPQAIATLFLAS